MPIVADLLIALLFAVALFLLFGAAIGARRPSQSLGAEAVLFFLLLFLVIWAGGVWMEPFGPPVYGVFWAPFLFVGLVIVLLLAALTPPSRRRPVTAAEAIQAERAREAEVVTFSVFFWILATILLIAILVEYFV